MREREKEREKVTEKKREREKENENEREKEIQRKLLPAPNLFPTSFQTYLAPKGLDPHMALTFRS